jgi:hypothetical protein
MKFSLEIAEKEDHKKLFHDLSLLSLIVEEVGGITGDLSPL